MSKIWSGDLLACCADHPPDDVTMVTSSRVAEGRGPGDEEHEDFVSPPPTVRRTAGKEHIASDMAR
ncbi:hypothetical protein [Streptomyces purpurogeneiscleroticus]|uniref:hypothetical protein n=1 Tax=Streptomyces purpurogeneiscleroticus TaxID=68259 RepID=UPI001CBC2B60|nr:hypothetical protein [Streptomyces purpurogeneiscleroticus]